MYIIKPKMKHDLDLYINYLYQNNFFKNVVFVTLHAVKQLINIKKT